MWKDPIVKEIHKIREQLAKESKYDLNIYFEKVKKMEKKEKPDILSDLTKNDMIDASKLSL